MSPFSPINSIADLRDMARRRLPLALFDYIDRGSYDEHTLARNRTDFDALLLRQRVMTDVSRLSLETTVLGEHCSMPVASHPRVSPACFTAMARSARLAPRMPPVCPSA